MENLQPEHLVAAHRDCHKHRDAIERSTTCGCFQCCETFPSLTINQWCDKDQTGKGQTAICPRCGIDSVLGGASGWPITPEFLEAMNIRWFGRRGSTFR